MTTPEEPLPAFASLTSTVTAPRFAGVASGVALVDLGDMALFFRSAGQARDLIAACAKAAEALDALGRESAQVTAQAAATPNQRRSQ